MGIALSAPLQLGIRFFRVPLPAAHSASLAVGLLNESATGLPCSAFVKCDQVGLRLRAGGNLDTSSPAMTL